MIQYFNVKKKISAICQNNKIIRVIYEGHVRDYLPLFPAIITGKAPTEISFSITHTFGLTVSN